MDLGDNQYYKGTGGQGNNSEVEPLCPGHTVKIKPIWTIGTTYGLDQGSYSEEEEGRKEEGERRAPNKAGPMRPPLLNGIK